MKIRNIRYLPILIAAVATLLLQGCAKKYSAIRLEESKIESVTATSLRSMTAKISLTVDNPTKSAFKVDNIHGTVCRHGDINAGIHTDDTDTVSGKARGPMRCTRTAELDRSVSVLSAGLILAEGDFESFKCYISADIHKGAFRKSVKRKNIPLRSIVKKLNREQR